MSNTLPDDEVLVYEIRPDPDGTFDVMIVASAAQAGEIVTRAALGLWDDGDGDEPAPSATVTCRTMKRADFEALPDN